MQRRMPEGVAFCLPSLVLWLALSETWRLVCRQLPLKSATRIFLVQLQIPKHLVDLAVGLLLDLGLMRLCSVELHMLLWSRRRRFSVRASRLLRLITRVALRASSIQNVVGSAEVSLSAMGFARSTSRQRRHMAWSTVPFRLRSGRHAASKIRRWPL